MATYSHTRLGTFEQCPLKFKLKYLDCVETNIENVEAFLGKRVHEALELLHKDLSAGKLVSLDELVDFYVLRWTKEWHSDVRIVRSDRSEEDYLGYGAECISNYYRGNYPFDHSRTIATEELIVFDLDMKRERSLQGYVDRISSRPDGTYEIHDYKTGRRIPSQSQLGDDRQLSLYQVGFQAMHPEARCVELVWHYLSRGLTFRVRRMESDLQQILRETNLLVDHIESEKTFPAHVGPLCDWCEFRGICPAWQ